MTIQHKRLTLAVAAVLGLSTSGALLAEVPFPEMKNSAASCDSVRWHEDMVAEFPKVIAACREVLVAKDGLKWARFDSKLEDVEGDGTVNLAVQNSRGIRVDQVSLTPKAGQVAYIDGRETEFEDLRRGQLLNLYMPEGGTGFSTQAGVLPAELVSVRRPIPAAEGDLQLGSVQFSLDSSVLTSATKRVLDSHARSLMGNPRANMLVIGHTSASATEAYNQSLSERRAKAVMDYLVSIPGMNARQVRMIGYGETRPIAREYPTASVNSDAAKANMRVSFEVSST